MGGPAGAQTAADTVRVDTPARANGAGPVSTIPLPNGRGIFYYRAGAPGGVRIRSRNGTRRDTVIAPVAAPPAAPTPEASSVPSVSVTVPPASAAPPAGGLTRLDLLELERNLIAAFNQRIASLERDRDRRQDPVQAAPQQAPIIVLPGQPTPQAPPAVAPRVPVPVAPRPPEATTTPDPGAPPRAAPEPGGVTVEEIERAILDTGLFRTTTVNFEFAKAALLPVSERTLDALGAVLLRYPALRIEVGGHTDNVGSDATNDRLSQRRAESVVDYLTAYGVSRDRLSAVGYGERQPVAANTSETGRALNRRVEFVVLNPEAAEQIRRTIREGVQREGVRDDELRDEGIPKPSDVLRRILREELERLRDDSPPSDG